MVGEQLLREALREEYGIRLEYEARSVGEHGKPFISSRPEIHYNISHSGKYVVCVVAPQEVGIDIQIHSAASNIKRILERTVPADLARQILDSPNTEKAFYTQWVLREAYVKWTGEGLSKDLRKINLEEGWYGRLWSETHGDWVEAKGYSDSKMTFPMRSMTKSWKLLLFMCMESKRKFHTCGCALDSLKLSRAFFMS